MKNCFCTIITEDYFPYAQTLSESLSANSASEQILYVLVSTEIKTHLVDKVPHGIRLLYVNDVCVSEIGKKIKKKYFNKYSDGFRWSMKPVLINYLIEQLGFDKVIFLDCDLFFFSRFDFLFDHLNTCDVLITPHWRSSDPHADPQNFQMQYNKGLFNGGFIGVNKHAIPTMEWWARACEYVCAIESDKGYYVDQTHLNLLPVFFEGVEILKHRGCNVASWNQLECKRVKRENGEVWINDKFPIIFIHFTPSTIKKILKGNDDLLLPHLRRYADTLRKYNGKLDIIAKYKRQLNARQTKTVSGVLKRFFRSALKRLWK